MAKLPTEFGNDLGALFRPSRQTEPLFAILLALVNVRINRAAVGDERGAVLTLGELWGAPLGAKVSPMDRLVRLR